MLSDCCIQSFGGFPKAKFDSCGWVMVTMFVDGGAETCSLI